jgi:hypothetical protein
VEKEFHQIGITKGVSAILPGHMNGCMKGSFLNNGNKICPFVNIDGYN